MNRKIISFLLLICFFSITFANEFQLSDFNFAEKKLEEFNSFECYSTIVDFGETPHADLHPILSVFANFDGRINDSSFISVELNDKHFVLWRENFVCGTDCVARVFIDKINTGDEIKFCLRTGASKITLQNKTKIGFYDTPVISVTNLSPDEIILGQRAKMKINIKNSGSKKADVFVQFVAEDLRSIIDITSFDIVEGNASANTSLNPGESKDFIFFIKPLFVSRYNLPSSELFFNNIFGESQRIISNHPQLTVLEPNQANITIIGREIIDDKFNFIINVKNNWGEQLTGELFIYPFDLVENSKINLNLNSFSEREFKFVTNNLFQGDYVVWAQLNTVDYNYNSENISFSIVENNYLFEIIFSIIAIIVTGIIFVFIYFEKNIKRL